MLAIYSGKNLNIRLALQKEYNKHPMKHVTLNIPRYLEAILHRITSLFYSKDYQINVQRDAYLISSSSLFLTGEKKCSWGITFSFFRDTEKEKCAL